jgi:hypothetical protein
MSVAEMLIDRSYGEEEATESGPNDCGNNIHYHNSNSAPTGVFIPTVVATGRT